MLVIDHKQGDSECVGGVFTNSLHTLYSSEYKAYVGSIYICHCVKHSHHEFSGRLVGSLKKLPMHCPILCHQLATGLKRSQIVRQKSRNHVELLCNNFTMLRPFFSIFFFYFSFFIFLRGILMRRLGTG